MDQDKLRRVAINSGSATIVVGILMFFFSNDATASMPFEHRVIASLIGVISSLIALRIFFAKFKF